MARKPRGQQQREGYDRGKSGKNTFLKPKGQVWGLPRGSWSLEEWCLAFPTYSSSPVPFSFLPSSVSHQGLSVTKCRWKQTTKEQKKAVGRCQDVREHSKPTLGKHLRPWPLAGKLLISSLHPLVYKFQQYQNSFKCFYEIIAYIYK